MSKSTLNPLTHSVSASTGGSPIVIIKGCLKRSQRAKVSGNMLRTISWLGVHPGKAWRIKRWHLYSVGLSLQHCKVTPGLSHLDVLYWVERGICKLVAPTKKAVESAEKAHASSVKASAIAAAKSNGKN